MHEIYKKTTIQLCVIAHNSFFFLKTQLKYYSSIEKTQASHKILPNAIYIYIYIF